jgi:hypothetical protein
MGSAIAVGGLIAACDPSGCSDVHASQVRFFQNGQLVFERSTIQHVTLDSSQLGGLPSVPLAGGGLSMDIFGEYSLAAVDNQGLRGQQIEAHLYVADLTATNTYLRDLGAAQPVVQWDARTNASALGGSVVVPFAPAFSWPSGLRYDPGLLSPSYFWPNTTPGAPASAPTGSGSIKSVRMYRPGLCGFEVPFTTARNDGLFDVVSDELFARFAANDKVKEPRRVYSRVTTLLDDGIDVFGPKGGFFLNFWFDGFFLVQSINFTANYEYQLTLDDGRLAVVPTRNELLVQPQQAFGDFAGALDRELPQALRDVFVERQAIGRDQLPMQCTDAEDATARARDFLGSLARDGAERLGYTDPADLDRVRAAVADPRNWFCDRDGFANFILRAKRLNVYANNLELVWFDEPDLDDPMYGAYAALAFDGRTGELCNRPRTVVLRGGDPLLSTFVQRRPIVTVRRPQAGIAEVSAAVSSADAEAGESLHVFACDASPLVNDEPTSIQTSLSLCAPPKTPLAEVGAQCAKECQARFASTITEPFGLFSSVSACTSSAPPRDTGFPCRGNGGTNYMNGGPSAYRLEGSGSLQLETGATVHVGLDPAEVTIVPCSDGTCPIVFSKLRLVQHGSASLGASVLAGLEIQNQGAALGTWLSDGSNRFELPAGALSLVAVAELDGEPLVHVEANAQPIRGVFAPDRGELRFSAELGLGGVAAYATLGGFGVGHPPVASFAPKGPVECNMRGGAEITFDAGTSQDRDLDTALFAWARDRRPVASGLTFSTFVPLGPHRIALDVFDARGAADEREATVNVVDTTPPMVTSEMVDPTCLWAPNHKLVLYEVGTGLEVSASDVCDPTPSVEIVDVTSDQSSTSAGSGGSETDIFIGQRSFCLRAERAGPLSGGRRYTVTLRLTDASGNTAVGEVVVQAPRDQSDGRCALVEPSRLVDEGDPRCLR